VEPRLFQADDTNIQYTGRIDFTDPKKPRFWAPGVYIKARFKGPLCDVVVNDEQQDGTNHNYLEIVVDDGKPIKHQTTGAANSIRAADGLADGPHTITVCKDTESGIGYLEFIGLRCDGLLPLPPRPARRLEFIGDSITCGAGSDMSGIPCDKGRWYDQENAYLSYGPLVARELRAEWHLTAVSGIGLVHSCCEMAITMPEVFDKVNLRGDAEVWDFKRYQPDAVTVCLGQNDGTDGQEVFRDAYVAFIQRIRSRYPGAEIICLTSPMAEPSLNAVLKENVRQVVQRVNTLGDKRVQGFFFYKSYRDGCGGHPDLEQHQFIANELSGYLRSVLGW
jgi:lysophospholipase L1-like esterase